MITTINLKTELLRAVNNIVKQNGVNSFTTQEVLDFMKSRGALYKNSTIKTHICSKCCINANKNHATVYNDYRRIENGKYELSNV